MVQRNANFFNRSAIAREKITKIVKDAQATVVNTLKGALTAVRNVNLDQPGGRLHIKEYDTAVPTSRELQYP